MRLWSVLVIPAKSGKCELRDRGSLLWILDVKIENKKIKWITTSYSSIPRRLSRNLALIKDVKLASLKTSICMKRTWEVSFWSFLTHDYVSKLGVVVVHQIIRNRKSQPLFCGRIYRLTLSENVVRNSKFK